MSDTKQSNFSEIGTRVAGARGKTGLSHAELSALTGISEAVIAGIEAGTYWASGDANIQDLLRRIAAACSEDPNTLHGGSFDPSTVGSLE